MIRAIPPLKRANNELMQSPTPKELTLRALLCQNLPEAIRDAAVDRLASSRLRLQSGLDDIGRGGEVRCRHAGHTGGNEQLAKRQHFSSATFVEDVFL